MDFHTNLRERLRKELTKNDDDEHDVMDDAMDIHLLKVNELKCRWSKLGLSIVDNKSELKNRLLESLKSINKESNMKDFSDS